MTKRQLKSKNFLKKKPQKESPYQPNTKLIAKSKSITENSEKRPKKQRN